jgi:hypothetical protein
MDIIDDIETLLEESRVRQGEAREQIFKALGQLCGLIFELDQVAPAVKPQRSGKFDRRADRLNKGDSAEPADSDNLK